MASAFNDMDITSANAQVILVVQDLYPTGIVLQQFSTDSMATVESIQATETRMGVDGYMVAGVSPNIISVAINLEANSPSKKALDNVWSAQRTNLRPYRCSLTIRLPSTGETFQFYRGVLKGATPVPSAQKVLSPTTWTFDFESMERI